MSISQMLLPEFDQEIASMRRTIERVPESKFDWAPHPRSMTMGRLASHIAEMPTWAATTLQQDSLDIAPVGQPPSEPANFKSRASLLEAFDKNAAAARAAIAGASDEQLRSSWSLLKGGQALMTMPKLAVVRSFVLNHCIHHRGQLTVYLRLNDVPVPSIYGPSADESAGF
jgi:uncharacterized damage-inducible protein DinB